MPGVLRKKPAKSLPKKVERKAPEKTASGRRKLPAKKSAPVAKPAPRGKDEYGITEGTDQSVILKEMIAGGADKHEVIDRCSKLFEGQTTTGGKPKPVSTVVNQLIHIMGERGFTVESTWRLVPPADGIVVQAPTRTRAAKPSATKEAPAMKKAIRRPGIAKKSAGAAPAKKTARKALPRKVSKK